MCMSVLCVPIHFHISWCKSTVKGKCASQEGGVLTGITGKVVYTHGTRVGGWEYRPPVRGGHRAMAPSEIAVIK